VEGNPETRSRQPFSIGMIVFFICSLLYVFITTDLWLHARDNAITTGKAIILDVGPLLPLIITLPLTVICALFNYSFRAMLTLLVGCTLVVGITYLTFLVQMYPYNEKPFLMEDIQLGVILGAVYIGIQLVIFWVVRKLPGLFSRATGK
jgi:hypothetical protein